MPSESALACPSLCDAEEADRLRPLLLRLLLALLERGRDGQHATGAALLLRPPQMERGVACAHTLGLVAELSDCS